MEKRHAALGASLFRGAEAERHNESGVNNTRHPAGSARPAAFRTCCLGSGQRSEVNTAPRFHLVPLSLRTRVHPTLLKSWESTLEVFVKLDPGMDRVRTVREER
ncbi:hypothetical protein AAFF_G00394310 [Aldrovandia affinis]|uniref:Uncharacterized protein n=1 Tax=Aldrovandia affinis TaxID=143900 RepID=A0AAD7WKW6_9TELE|nr:hypothetical protein AAFF_G00394310 [Aldrovandia affinis]